MTVEAYGAVLDRLAAFFMWGPQPAVGRRHDLSQIGSGNRPTSARISPDRFDAMPRPGTALIRAVTRS